MSTCPEWCDDHQDLGDVSYHQSKSLFIEGHEMFLTGPQVGCPEGGIFLLGPGEGMPAQPLNLNQAKAELQRRYDLAATQVFVASRLVGLIEDFETWKQLQA